LEEESGSTTTGVQRHPASVQIADESGELFDPRQQDRCRGELCWETSPKRSLAVQHERGAFAAPQNSLRSPFEQRQADRGEPLNTVNGSIAQTSKVGSNVR